MGLNPYEWQLKDVNALVNGGGVGLLALEAGSGKTLEACLTMKELAPSTTLIIAPDSTLNSPLAAWPKTVGEVVGQEVRLIGNRNKATQAALRDFNLGYPGVYATTRQFFSRQSTDISDWYGDMLITDECFIAGTEVDTPQGPRKIEDIREGDCVYGFDHASGKVTLSFVSGTMKQMKDEIAPSGATVNHPYFVVGEGYYPLGDIKETDHVYVRAGKDVRSVSARVLGIQETPQYTNMQSPVRIHAFEEAGGGTEVSGVQRVIHATGSAKKPGLLQSILRGSSKGVGVPPKRGEELYGVRGNIFNDAFKSQKDVFQQMCAGVDISCSEETQRSKGLRTLWYTDGGSGVLPAKILRSLLCRKGDNRAPRAVERFRFSTASFRAYDEQQPVATPRSSGKDAGYSVKEGAKVRPFKWRKWHDKPIRRNVTEGIGLTLGSLLCCINGRYSAVHRFSESLQTGFGLRRTKGVRRGGWQVTQSEESTGGRQAEGAIFGAGGMDPLEIHQPRSPQRYESVRRAYKRSTKVEVYNLETTTSNYFANGVLVHNCHQLTTAQTITQRKWSGYDPKDDPINSRFGYRLALSGTFIRQDFANAWGTMRFLWPELSKRDQIAYSNYYMWCKDRMDSVAVYTNKRDAWGNPKTVQQFTQETIPGLLLSQMPTVVQHKRREYCCEYHPNGFLTTEKPIEIPVYVDLSAKQLKAITELEKHFVTWIDDNPLVTDLSITQKQRIRQLCLGEAHVSNYLGWDKYGEPVDKSRLEFSEDCNSPFAEATFDILDSLPRDEPVVIYMESQRFAQVLTAKLNKRNIKAKEYSGKTKANLYGLGEDYRVLVGVISAMGTGTNGLQERCKTEIYLETPISHTNQEQVFARLDRIGGSQVVRYIVHDTTGYSEGRFSKLLETKLRVNESLRRL